MSVDRITAPVADATEAAGKPSKTEQRAQLAKLASEFESLMLSNMLRDMRSAGKWSDDESSDTLGAGAFNQTFDTELARSLSQSGGFGLSSFLMKAFDAYADASGERAGTATPTSLESVARTFAAKAGISLPSSATTAASVEALTTDARSAKASAGEVTSAFGWRKDPLTGAMSFHRGVDLKAAEGDPVAATAAGRVVFSGTNGGYGNSVVVEHANGVQTRYAHLSENLVRVGDQVLAGQAIGKAGHTGRATGTHVHYEVLAGGQAVDPLR